jgi:hypothetical protein
MTKPTSLAALAAKVQANADQYERGWRNAQLSKQLIDRRNQFDGFIESVSALEKKQKLLAAAELKVRFPKRRIGPIIKRFEKLESTIKIDIAKVVEADAVDPANLKEALKECEQELLSNWQRFAKPTKEFSGADALADVPELESSVAKLRDVRVQLENHCLQLPPSAKEVAAVRKLKETIGELTVKLQTHGYDEDVLEFLTKTRSSVQGVSLAETLKNPKVRKWLETGKNAAKFIILHKSGPSA